MDTIEARDSYQQGQSWGKISTQRPNSRGAPPPASASTGGWPFGARLATITSRFSEEPGALQRVTHPFSERQGSLCLPGHSGKWLPPQKPLPGVTLHSIAATLPQPSPRGVCTSCPPSDAPLATRKGRMIGFLLGIWGSKNQGVAKGLISSRISQRIHILPDGSHEWWVRKVHVV